MQPSCAILTVDRNRYRHEWSWKVLGNAYVCFSQCV